jgi:hypothetical protein
MYLKNLIGAPDTLERQQSTHLFSDCMMIFAFHLCSS